MEAGAGKCLNPSDGERARDMAGHFLVLSYVHIGMRFQDRMRDALKQEDAGFSRYINGLRNGERHEETGKQ
jgi:hypothetical protein